MAWSRGPPDREDRIGCRPRGAHAASSRARGGTLRLAGKSDTRKLVVEGRSRSLDHIRSGRPLCRRRRKPAGTGAGPFRGDQRSLRIFLRLRQRNFRRSRGEDDATGDGAGVAVVGLSRRQSFARPWRLALVVGDFRRIERPGGLRSSRIIAFERLDPGAFSTRKSSAAFLGTGSSAKPALPGAKIRGFQLDRRAARLMTSRCQALAVARQ